MRAAAALDRRTDRLRPGGSFVAAEAVRSWRLLAVMVAAATLLTVRLRFTVDTVDLPLAIEILAMLCAAAAVMRHRGWRAPAAAIEGSVLVLAAIMATACLSVLLATTGLPYRDAQLGAIDARLVPWNWLDMFRLLRKHDMLVGAMCAAYRTLFWQPFLLVAVLAVTGREAACWRFVHAWCLALIGCVAVFPFVPAVGAYVHHGLSPGDIPALTVDIAWRQVAVLDRIRSGTLHALNPASMTGLISFPSFHACAAVLLVHGFRQLPLLRWPFALLNAVMLLSTPLIGAHYFVDVLGGVVLATVAIRATAAPVLPIRRRTLGFTAS